MWKFSLHAKEQAFERSISENVIFDVLENADKIINEGEGQLCFQKVVVFENGSKYLIRVFVNSLKSPNLIKTVYRTSKIEKYL